MILQWKIDGVNQYNIRKSDSVMQIVSLFDFHRIKIERHLSPMNSSRVSSLRCLSTDNALHVPVTRYRSPAEHKTSIDYSPFNETIR